MLDQITAIASQIVDSFLHIWPYLLVTIPLAVAVRMSRASQFINRAFQGRPIIAILLATVVGAFSPFCSCGVIPVVAALLISGVPLAPVMSFWIASPSMDPEAFFLSVATLGWELAVWRLAATIMLSLGAGLVTHVMVKKGWLGQQNLRKERTTPPRFSWTYAREGLRRLKNSLTTLLPQRRAPSSTILSPTVACCTSVGSSTPDSRRFAVAAVTATASGGGVDRTPARSAACDAGGGQNCSQEAASFWHRLTRETWSATWMVAKFMALAFLLTALINQYIPSEWVAGLLGHQNRWAIPVAAVLGVPVYTSNMTALPMLGALLAQGMDPSAALAFLISGPTTTLPAMAAVWGLASRRVFGLYVSLSLVGAVVLGFLHSLVTGLL
jgi:uncharacterized membrane protein YraQ (UPF0718 family)